LCRKDQKTVFLQHGIIKDELAHSAFDYDKCNIDYFVCSAQREYEFVKEKYNYPEKSIGCVGLCRFDYLLRARDEVDNILLIMPTWRMYLSVWDPLHEGVWKLSGSFTSSAYFKFYNALINDERLISAARAAGYQICFMPHPNIMGHIDVFDKHPDVIFFGLDKKYNEAYAQSSLVLTDYSSAVFDFAYMRKPIIYTHFDRDEFFDGQHVYTKGYFDYERDGFGEITYDYETTVDLIIKYMANGCRLDAKYRERIDSFFAYSDKNNSKRVYEKIKELNTQ